MQQSRIAVCGGGKDTVEVGVPRAEQQHRQRGARAQLGAEMRDTTRLVGGRAAGSTTTLFSPGERVRRGTSLRWRLMERSWRSGLSHDQGSVAGARTDGQRVIASQQPGRLGWCRDERRD